MISCGEPSGDLYAGALATEILRADPATAITGFGGARLEAAGAVLIDHFSGLSVTGLLEVARLLPRTYATYRRILRDADTTRPDVFVAIDFPDFNFTLARALKRRGVPVVYYISPQLWAWRRGRMRTMGRIADRVLVIFPFEEAIYREAGIPVQWVGHPLLDLAERPQPRGTFLARAGLDPTRPVVALLPGSRRNEVRAILPGLARAAALIRAQVPGAQFLVARAPHLADELFEPLSLLADLKVSATAVADLKVGATDVADLKVGATDRADLKVSATEMADLKVGATDRADLKVSTTGLAEGVAVVNGEADNVLASADVALVASGTVTVQAALHECPMVVVYRLSPLTYRLGRPFVHVDTYAMANLVAGERIVPELIQDEFTPAAVAGEALKVLMDPAHAMRVRESLRRVRGKLGTPGASRRAAQAVLQVAAHNVRSGPANPME